MNRFTSAVALVAVLGACNSSPAPSDASVDATTGCALPEYALIQFQYPGGDVRSACMAPVTASAVAINYVRDSSGSCVLHGTGSGFQGGQLDLLVAAPTDVFATSGPSSVTVELADLAACGTDAGPCAFGAVGDQCTFVVTTPGGSGSVVEGHVAAPCLLHADNALGDAGSGTVTIVGLSIHGHLVVATRDATGDAAAQMCP